MEAYHHKAQYYGAGPMGIFHHSTYIRRMEAPCTEEFRGVK